MNGAFESYAWERFEPYALREEVVKGAEYYTDRLVYAFEGWRRYPDIQLVSPKKYVRGEVWIEIVFLDRDGNFYVAIAEVAPRGTWRQIRELCERRYAHDRDRLMLVYDVEHVEVPQRVIGIPSMIRLKHLDVLPHFRSQLSDLLTSTWAIPRCTVSENREGTLAGGRLEPESRKLEHEMVKRCPHIMNRIPGNQSKSRRWRALELNPEQLHRIVRVELLRDSHGVKTMEGLQLMVQGVEVFFRPIQFEPWPIYGRGWGWHALYSTHGEGKSEQEDSEDAQGRVRDSGAHQGRRDEGVREGGGAHNAAQSVTFSPPEEVATQTAPSRRHGGYTARHTRLGSLEDA